MDDDSSGNSSLRRQGTFEIVDNDNGIQRRQSSRKHAALSVRKITSSLSNKSSMTAKLPVTKGASFKSRTPSKAGSIQKGNSTMLSKKSSTISSLSKKKSSIAGQNDPKCQLSSQGSLSKQISKSSSMNAKAVLISRLSKQSSQKSVKNGVELWYLKGSFVATRAPDNYGEKYYLCKVLQNIYNFTKKARVRWLDRVPSRHERKYKMKYLDTIDPACVLTGVEVHQLSHLFYIIQDSEHEEIKEVLDIVQNFEIGKYTMNDIKNDIHEVVQIEEPPKKKAKLTEARSKKDGCGKSPKKRTKLVKTASQKAMDKAKKNAQKKAKTEKKPRKKKDEGEKKEPKRKTAEKVDELKLTPRPDVKILAKDPLFETNTPMPYISKRANSKLIFRAIYMKDTKLLKKLLKDKSKIYELFNKTVDCNISPLEAAVIMNDPAIFELLLHEYCGKKFEERKIDNHSDKVSLHKLSTGHYNARSLGISHILKIQASRGSKEGNDAFLKEEREIGQEDMSGVYNDFLAPHGLSDSLTENLKKFFKTSTDDFYQDVSSIKILPMLLLGHNKACGEIVKACVGYYRRSFNQLMKEVLSFETEDLSGCAPSAVKYISKSIDKLTPFHYAAVNPNPKYLEKLLSVEPLAHISDFRGRRPIHFAACCKTTDNIELLLKWGARINETCQSHQTPLHYAILARRPANVKYLLQKASESPDISHKKFGVGGINHPFPGSLSPLQKAIQMEEKEMIETLLSYGAAVNAKSSVSSMQTTPLMSAAATGNLDIVKLMVKHGAVVEQKDRLGRTALIHACMNGATKVLSYLIHIGSNPERPDSSDNFPIHYAAAYGWYFTLRLLIDVGVDINVLNMWKFSPVAVAYMKGHVGIVRELLMNDKVDINQRMEDGTSLLFQACESDLCQDDLFEQIEFLVKTKGANCDIKDNNGKTALFYLANSSIENEDKVKDAQKQSIKIANLLLDNGCDLSAVDNRGFTATMEALGSMTNLALAEVLLKAGGKVLCPPDVAEEEPKSSLLHNMIDKGHEHRLTQVLQLIIKYKYAAELIKMAQHVDAEGYTPLLYAMTRFNHDLLFNQRPEQFKTENDEEKFDGLFHFVKYLVTKCNVDVNARVTEKFIPVEQKSSITSNIQKYCNSTHGEKSALHLLLLRNPLFHTLNTEQATNASRIISFLVEKGAKIDYHDVQGMTPIGTAVNLDSIATVNFLIKSAKGNVNLPNKVSPSYHIEELSHNMCADKLNEYHPSIDMILTLINNGIDVNARSQNKEHLNGTFLHILLQKKLNRRELLKVINKLSETSFNFDAQDDHGRTVLHYTFRGCQNVMNDTLELESKLMSKCSLNKKDFKQRTPLHYIFKKKKERHYWRKPEPLDPSQVLRLACQKADKTLISEQDYKGKSILHLAAEKGFFVSVYLLTDRMEKQDVNQKDSDGNTPLALAIKNKHEGCSMALIQCGASLKEDVVTVSEAEVARRKQEKKAKKFEDDESDNDRKVWTLEIMKNVKTQAISRIPLYKAAMGHEMTGTVLQFIDASKERSGLTFKDLIWTAMETGQYNLALQIMHTSCSDAITASILRKSYEMGRNLLHLLPLSCEETPTEGYSSITEIARLLLSFGISSDSIDNYGCTPIQYAILNRHFELANYIAANGSGFNFTRTDKFGRGYLAALFWRIHSKQIDGRAWNFLDDIIDKLDVDATFDLPLNPDLVEANIPNLERDSNYWQSYPEFKTTALIASIVCMHFDSNISYNLLASGANPNTRDGNNISPLMHAVKQNKSYIVRQLLHYDFDPDFKEDLEHNKVEKEKKKQKDNTSIFRLKAGTADDKSSEESESEEEAEVDKEKENKINQTPKEYKPVKKTSSVNLDQKDSNGRTALHYVASPTPLATFDNPVLAFILIKGGAKSVPDKFGFTPLTLAAETGAIDVIEKLKELGHGSNRSFRILPHQTFRVDDGMDVDDKPDFLKDADKILRRYDSEMMVDDVYIHEVDIHCNVTDAQLMKDKDLDIWFDVLMTRIDVKRLEWGLYNFYKMQLVYQPEKDLFILFTRWGRIGETGQFQHTPFQDRNAAIKEFAKIFRAKSGNKWVDIKSYERKPNKYRLLEDMARKAPPQQKDVILNLKSNVFSELPQDLYSLIHTLMSPEIMEMSMRHSRCVNTASLPFGQLNKERLMEGEKLLERIQKCIDEVEEHKKKTKSEIDKEALEALTKNCEMIAELSNDYFHVIPQQNFSCEKCEPLNKNTIMEHLYFISNMLNYEIVSKMLLAAMNHRKINPVDFVYSCLGCKVELMTPDDPMAQLILRYISLTATKKVFGIYKLKREGEEERLKATGLGNYHLLWHGTQATNILSILSRGLLVAPPNSSRTAWAYGKGIYFADEFSKSNDYVRCVDGKTGFMLLCQVALGNCVRYGEDDDSDDAEDKDKRNRQVKQAKNSTVVESKDQSHVARLKLKSGVKIPYEKPNYYRAREYIVENPAQVCLRYIIEYER